MKTHKNQDKFRGRLTRRGAAAVEAALVTPVLIVITLGAIDVGQFVNVGQTVNSASREGARRAVRNDATSTSDVQSTMHTYIANSFPNVSSATLQNATTITMTTTPAAGGPATTVTDLSAVTSGDQITVTATLSYDAVRWASGFPGLNGWTITTSTTMRRE